MRRLAILTSAIALFALLILQATPLQAQDEGGLSDEELALVERLAAAQEAMADLDSFVVDRSAESGFTFSSTGAFRLFSSSTTTTAITSYHIQGEDPNIRAEFTRSHDSDVTVDNEMQGEVVLAEGTLYVAVEREITEDDDDDLTTVGELPEGWFTVATEEDVASLEALSFLDLNNYLGETWVFFDATNILFTEADSVTLTEDTLEDGTAVEVITLTRAISDEEVSGTYPNQVTTTSRTTRTVAVALDADDHIRQIVIESGIAITARSGTGTSASTTTLSESTTQTINVTAINEPLEPAPAPAIDEMQ